MDKDYEVSRINERVEQPLTTRSDSAGAEQAVESESGGGFGEVASQAAVSETESPQGLLRQADEEDDAAASAVAESAGQVAVPDRKSPLRSPVLGQQRSHLKSPANAYVGKPLPPGSMTFGGPTAQKDAAGTVSGREKTKSGDTNRVTPATDKQGQEQGKKEGPSESKKRDTSQGNATPGDTQDGQSTAEEGEGDESDIADDSSDAAPTDEESTDERAAPRRPIAWPPINGPWSTFPAGPGAMPLPTTGLGTSPSWGAAPPATATGWQAAPTTGIGAAPAWSGIGSAARHDGSGGRCRKSLRSADRHRARFLAADARDRKHGRRDRTASVRAPRRGPAGRSAGHNARLAGRLRRSPLHLRCPPRSCRPPAFIAPWLRFRNRDSRFS